MKKKVVTLVLCGLMAVSMVACGGTKSGESVNNTSSSSVEGTLNTSTFTNAEEEKANKVSDVLKAVFPDASTAISKSGGFLAAQCTINEFNEDSKENVVKALEDGYKAIGEGENFGIQIFASNGDYVIFNINKDSSPELQVSISDANMAKEFTDAITASSVLPKDIKTIDRSSTISESSSSSTSTEAPQEGVSVTTSSVVATS